MKKKFKILLGIGIPVLALVISGGLWAYFNLLHHYKGKEVVDNWNESDTFDIQKITTLQKKKGQDFKILNLADLQVADLDGLSTFSTVHEEMDDLINTYQPDLVTLTGDQTMSNENRLFLKSIIRLLDKHKVPYAPIFGNHDFGNEHNSGVCSENYCCDLYEDGEYSLFKRGPTNIGPKGNYVINIEEDGKIVTSLYMMALAYEPRLTEQQIKWFRWNAEGIKVANGGVYSRGIIFTHKDLREHWLAYNYYLNHPEAAEGNVYNFDGWARVDNGDFTKIAKNCGVFDFVCAHEHAKNFTINYDGARYTFAVKSSETVYYHEDENIYLNGATEILIGTDSTRFEHHYVERGKYHLD